MEIAQITARQTPRQNSPVYWENLLLSLQSLAKIPDEELPPTMKNMRNEIVLELVGLNSSVISKISSLPDAKERLGHINSIVTQIANGSAYYRPAKALARFGVAVWMVEHQES